MTSLNGIWLTRYLFQRSLGLIYLMAFLVTLNQFRPLLGSRGLLPALDFMKQVRFWESPSLFYFFTKDSAFTIAAWGGVFLSCLAISGFSDRYSLWFSMSVWGALWLLYLSFVNVGQVFYGFGWESILLEAGFYTIFLGSSSVEPPPLMLWMQRWLLFRIMFGAGLIKLRGDACWRDLTCLNYHYETQPMPNPLSWYFHWAPEWTHRAGVVFNHVAELVVPFGYFVPGTTGAVAGMITILFQLLIMASGNLSWLNALTLVLTIPLFNDRWLRGFVPVEAAIQSPMGMGLQAATMAVTLVVAWLSLRPIGNMLSPRQIMNTTYNPFHLVGTYGAFGGITRTRYEVIIEGTEETPTASTVWKPYEFKGKPGDPRRLPPVIAPYHLRLDWLMWFAAMSGPGQHPWFFHLMAKLLQNDPETLSLLKMNPFPHHAPLYVRAELYEYHFTTPAEKNQMGSWWKRQRVGEYFPAVSLATPGFHRALAQMDWL